jgi:hypothetical protein
VKVAVTLVLTLALLLAMVVAGCGGGSNHPGPTTFDHLADWLEEEGECECEEVVGGTITEVELVKKGSRYVIK